MTTLRVLPPNIATDQAPLVSFDLVVFSTPEEAEPLLRSFGQMVSKNMQGDPEERTGAPSLVAVDGFGLTPLPAYQGAVWSDMDVEQAIDEWVELQVAGPAFVVAMVYSQSPYGDGFPALLWVGGPDVNMQANTLSDLPLQDFAAVMPADTAYLFGNSNFALAAARLALAHPDAEMQPLRAAVAAWLAQDQARVIDATTPQVDKPRPGLRL